MRKINLLYFSYFVSIVALFVYSFTQVDLSLTLTRASIWKPIQNYVQHIGYFQRPLSTAIFLIIISLLFIIYALFLRLSYLEKLNRKKIWILIILGAVLLVFSYNAFSYDMFNYIFDAKIITHYHLNPYVYKPLDFPHDPMLSFMHWVQVPSRYGPAWFLLTAPLSFLGFNFFLPTFFLFKGLASVCFLGSAFLIEKISQKIPNRKSLFALVVFAFNPLVIIESLVSSHNDTEMMFFALLGIYFVINKKTYSPLISTVFSALIKFVTGVLAIPILFYLLSGKFTKQKQSIEGFLKTTLLFMTAAFFFILTRMEVQPWYFLWILPFIALQKFNKYLIIFSFGVSLGLILRYSEYLYLGHWNNFFPSPRDYLTLLTIGIFIVLMIILRFKSSLFPKHS